MKSDVLLLALLACTSDALALPTFALGPITINFNAYGYSTSVAQTVAVSKLSSTAKTSTSLRTSSSQKAPSSASSASRSTLISSARSNAVTGSVVRASSASGDGIVSAPTLSTKSFITASVISRLGSGSSFAGTGTAFGKSPSASGFSSSKAALSSGCIVTRTDTVVMTTIPTATITTYINIAYSLLGDDLGVVPTGVLTTITNDYTTDLTQTLTVTTTSVQPQFLSYTTTVTEYPPASFVPVQDSLSGAGYDGKFDEASAPGRRQADRKQRRAVTGNICVTTITTFTSTLTLPTRVAYITDTHPVVRYQYPVEDFTLYLDTTAQQDPSGTTSVTKVVGTPLTRYASTLTVTTTITTPTATSTIYAACTASNYADYILQADGTKSPINFVGQNKDTDFSFMLGYNEKGKFTAYECCAYGLTHNAGAWFLFGPAACAVLYPSDERVSNGIGSCRGQADPTEQFDAAFANVTQTAAGNGYCGKITSSYFSTVHGS